MVACQLPKLIAQVRFPLPAPKTNVRGRSFLERASLASGDRSASPILRRLNLAVVRELFVAAKVRPIARRPPITHQPLRGRDLHEARVGADFIEFGPEQDLLVEHRQEARVIEQRKCFLPLVEQAKR